MIKRNASYLHSIERKELFQFTSRTFEDYGLGSNTGSVSTVMELNGYYAPLIDPKRKMMFCHIPKNSCTKVKLLFAELNGKSPSGKPPFDFMANKVLGGDLSVHYEMQDLVQQIQSKNEFDHILRNDSWTAAVFIRDPVERFVSAYIDKCLGSQQYCGTPHPTFDEWVRQMDDHFHNSDPCTFQDHFRPQFCYCDLWQHFKHFRVYAFNHVNRDEQIDKFLDDYDMRKYGHIFKTKTSHSNSHLRRSKDLREDLMKNVTTMEIVKKNFALDYAMFFN